MNTQDLLFVIVTFAVILSAFLIATNWQAIRKYFIVKFLIVFWRYIIIRKWLEETKDFFKAHWRHPVTKEEEKELADNSFNEPLFV